MGQLLDLLTASGVTTAQAGAVLDVDPRLLDRVDAGRQPLRLDLVLGLAQLLGVDRSAVEAAVPRTTRLMDDLLLRPVPPRRVLGDAIGSLNVRSLARSATVVPPRRLPTQVEGLAYWYRAEFADLGGPTGLRVEALHDLGPSSVNATALTDPEKPLLVVPSTGRPYLDLVGQSAMHADVGQVAASQPVTVAILASHPQPAGSVYVQSGGSGGGVVQAYWAGRSSTGLPLATYETAQDMFVSTWASTTLPSLILMTFEDDRSTFQQDEGAVEEVVQAHPIAASVEPLHLFALRTGTIMAGSYSARTQARVYDVMGYFGVLGSDDRDVLRRYRDDSIAQFA